RSPQGSHSTTQNVLRPDERDGVPVIPLHQQPQIDGPGRLFERKSVRRLTPALRGERRMDGAARPRTAIIAPLRWISAWGPGLLVMLADTDAGNVVTGAQAGARWGYRLLPLLLLLIPMLYMVQELTVRLGIYTGRGHGELIRERFGVGWALLS